MTKVEAIKVFDGLRREYRAIKPGDDRRALQALVTARVVPGGLSTSISLALETFRLTFDEIDRWEQPGNRPNLAGIRRIPGPIH